MANLIEYLTEQDKKNILTWIEHYGINVEEIVKYEYEPFPTTVDAILAEWARAKEKLYHMFGDKFIISKQITITKKPAELRAKMYDNVTKLCPLRTAMHEYGAEYNWSYEDICRITELFFVENLVENKVPAEHTFKLGDGAEYKMRRGQKITRAIPNLARKMNINETLIHTFLNNHSMVMNDATSTGELCFSLHPLDFMTMSDNDNNWSSCMKWRGNGAYRIGTIDMMNSPSVICVYLKAHSKKLAISHTDFIWNSKKWRELFIINDDLITGVKGYPYQNETFEDEALLSLAQLSPEKYKPEPMWIYPNEEYNYPWGVSYFEFLTNCMYNDIIENDNPIRMIMSNKFLANPVNDYVFNYSGEATCIFCGEPMGKLLNTDILICSNCRKESPTGYCEICGAPLYSSRHSLWTEIENEFYCHEHVPESIIVNFPKYKRIKKSNMQKIYLARKKDAPNVNGDVFNVIAKYDIEEFVKNTTKITPHKTPAGMLYYNIEDIGAHNACNMFMFFWYTLCNTYRECFIKDSNRPATWKNLLEEYRHNKHMTLNEMIEKPKK